MISAPQWFPMTASDIADVAILANSIHIDYPEQPEIFAERQKLAPKGCYVLRQGTIICGYIISHPWQCRNLPALNTLLGLLPNDPDTYYIHDIVIHPHLRGGGWPARALSLITEIASEYGLPTLSLVSIGNALGYWRKQGFVAVNVPELRQKLRSYDEQATYMQRSISS